MKTDSETDTEVCPPHRWLLGQPENGKISAVCRKCGIPRHYPAVLDDLDPGVEPESKVPGVATAVGGARPSSVASPSEEEPEGDAPPVQLRRRRVAVKVK